MAGTIKAKYLRILEIYAYIYTALLVLAWFAHVAQIIDLSLTGFAVVAAMVSVVYYAILFRWVEGRLGRRIAYTVGVVLSALPLILIALTTTSLMTIAINSTALALLIFLSAALGPSVPVGLVWALGVGYIIAFSGHIPSPEAIRITIVLLLLYIVAALLGWLLFNRFYIREDPEVELMRHRLRAEQLKSDGVLAAINDGIAIVSHNGIAIHANDKFISMLAIEREELIGRYYADVANARVQVISSTSKKPRIAQNIAEVFATKQTVVIDSLTFQYTNDTRLMDFSITVSPIKNDDGDISAVMVILRDITGLMRLQRAKDALIMTASHELRTPITVIAGYADLLLGAASEQLSEKQRHYIERTKETTARLTEMINDMLEMSKLESGEVANQPVTSNIKDVIEAMVENQLSLFASKNVRLRLKANEARVFADKERLQRVLKNILNNAFKFTPEGGEVEVASQVVDKLCIISVSDTGPGVQQEHIGDIFEKFSKLDKTGAIHGTGLGLAIAKSIVDNWGGTITAENVPSGGLKVSFTVPLAEETLTEKK